MNKALPMRRPFILVSSVFITFGALYILIFGTAISIVQPTTYSEPQPTAGPQRIIAILDDNANFALTMAESIAMNMRKMQVRTYLSCNQLLADIPAYRFIAYFVDYNLGSELGTACIPQIRAVHASSVATQPVITLMSADDVKNKADEVGVQFFSKSKIATLEEFLTSSGIK